MKRNKKIKLGKKAKLKKRLKELKIQDFGLNLEKIWCVCKQCKTNIYVSTNNPEAYTKEYKDNFLCLACKPFKSNKKRRT